MKPVRSLSLGLILAGLCGLASPALAHKPRVFVPQPRQVSAEVEYRVVILASNLGAVPRRFHVSRIVPVPFGEPLREMIHGAYVPPGDTHLFTLSEPSDTAGLLEVIGAPQIVVRARLEIWGNGTRLGTTSLPAVRAHEHEEAVIHHDGGGGGLERQNDLHLQGLARKADGSVTTDLTLVNFDEHAGGECGISILDSKGEGLLGLPFLYVPVAAAIVMNDVLADAGDESGEMEEAWGAANCEEDTYTVWAAVYRDGGRQVEYILPSGDLRPSHGSTADPSRWVKP